MKRCSEYYVGSGFAAVGNGVADVDGDGYGDGFGVGYGCGTIQYSYEDQERL